MTMHKTPLINHVNFKLTDEQMQTGGQHFDMPTGRLDGMVSTADKANNNLVSTRSSATELTRKFLEQGLGQDDMITLSGKQP